MADKYEPTHVVVDGSNLATEGRTTPSLAQLEEAVASYMEEQPKVQVTVVVDATFAHRIDKSESKRFEEGIENNELVAPPAGAIGRGDAFVLSIADKANSIVLSNDSFQEFHGQYPWLFEEGRLVGGKPVPHVGWVWVERNPVRGPVSRKATREVKPSKSNSRSRGGRRQDSSVGALSPMPVPTAPPQGAKATASAGGPVQRTTLRRDAPKGGEMVNELMPFLDFVEANPVGSLVAGVVDAYSSHGAYVIIGDVRAYVPLRMMSDPPPRSAKKALAMGAEVELVVVSFAPTRRSIDCARPDMAERMLAEVAAAESTEGNTANGDAELTDEALGRRQGRSSRGSSRSEAPSARGSRTAQGAAGSPAKKTAAPQKTAAKKTAPTKKTASKKPAAKKAAVTKKTASKKTAATKKVSAKKAAATKKTASKKTAATKKASAKKAAVTKKPAAKKAAATKKTAAKKTATIKSGAKKTAAKEGANGS